LRGWSRLIGGRCRWRYGGSDTGVAIKDAMFSAAEASSAANTSGDWGLSCERVDACIIDEVVEK
jgi:hypothetical protein